MPCCQSGRVPRPREARGGANPDESGQIARSSCCLGHRSAASLEILRKSKHLPSAPDVKANGPWQRPWRTLPAALGYIGPLAPRWQWEPSEPYLFHAPSMLRTESTTPSASSPTKLPRGVACGPQRQPTPPDHSQDASLGEFPPGITARNIACGAARAPPADRRRDSIDRELLALPA
jgi:hypothetical protein